MGCHFREDHRVLLFFVASIKIHRGFIIVKICILSEYAYLWLKKSEIAAGGAELQMVTLAKGLRDNQHDISIVVFEGSPSLMEEIEGMKVYSPFRINHSGYSYFKPWNTYKLFKVLNYIDADIYIQRAVTPLTGIISLFALLKKKIFIYSVASDKDVTNDLDNKLLKNLRCIPYNLGIKYSAHVVCQSEHQKKLLMQKIGKKSSVIKNIYQKQTCNHEEKHKSKDIVLWVGRIDPIKRPEMFMQLAKSFPETHFQLIGAPNGSQFSYYTQIAAIAKEINNLEFIGSIPHHKMDEYYKKASMLICTSITEGFPNTFLEAWGNGIPVISLGINPDEVINKYNLGFCSANFEDLIENTRILLKNKELCAEIGANGMNYVEREHSLQKIVDGYEQLFQKIE